MTGLELVAGYLIAWAVRKARVVGRRVDEEADAALEAGLDRLHDLVAQKLRGDSSVAKLEEEVAERGTASDRTQRRVRDAVEEAVESDSDFSAALTEVLAHLEASKAAGGAHAEGPHAVAVGGDVHIEADRGSAAAWSIGQVSLGAQPPQPPGPADPRPPDRSRD